MALKFNDMSIMFDMDEFTWDDWVKARTMSGLLEVCGRICKIEIDGVEQENTRKILGQLGYREIKYVDQLLLETIKEMSNPTNGAGKN